MHVELHGDACGSILSISLRLVVRSHESGYIGKHVHAFMHCLPLQVAAMVQVAPHLLALSPEALFGQRLQALQVRCACTLLRSCDAAVTLLACIWQDSVIQTKHACDVRCAQMLPHMCAAPVCMAMQSYVWQCRPGEHTYWLWQYLQFATALLRAWYTLVHEQCTQTASM